MNRIDLKPVLGMPGVRDSLPLAYRYVAEWSQWRWDCLDCGAYGLRSDSRYNMRDTQVIATRHNCR